MNRLEWILGIMLAALLVVVVALSLIFWFREETPEPNAAVSLATEVASFSNKVEPTPVHVGQTAQIAYTAAQRTAVSWQPDATLLNVTATWPQGSSRQDLMKGETTWAMTFVSPATDKMALISVIENQANIITQGPLKKEVKPIGVSSWELDSAETIEQFLNEAGDAFMRDQGITILTMTLAADPENGRVHWQLTLVASQSLATLTMRIDAASGEILALDKSA